MCGAFLINRPIDRSYPALRLHDLLQPRLVIGHYILLCNPLQFVIQYSQDELPGGFQPLVHQHSTDHRLQGAAQIPGAGPAATVVLTLAQKEMLLKMEL